MIIILSCLGGIFYLSVSETVSGTNRRGDGGSYDEHYMELVSCAADIIL